MTREREASAIPLARRPRFFSYAAVAAGMLLAVFALGASSAAAAENLTIIAGIEGRQRVEIVSRFRAAGHDVVTLDRAAVDVAGKLIADIERGNIGEADGQRPPHLPEFSKLVLAAVPRLPDYKRIHVVSPAMLPIELVQNANGEFAGDSLVVSHEFHDGRRLAPVTRREQRPFASYVIEAVMGMPAGTARAEQDIVQMALSLEGTYPVELHFGSGRKSLERTLLRDDVGVLHIDTHGSEGGDAIQVSRGGAMLPARALPRRVRAPVVLLFGCEGVANARAFGAVLRQRGADAVISSFAKFESFGLTGDATREKRIYEAFFQSIGAGEDIGTALLRLRQAARAEASSAGSARTLTRLFFVLLGNSRLTLRGPAGAN